MGVATGWVIGAGVGAIAAVLAGGFTGVVSEYLIERIVSDVDMLRGIQNTRASTREQYRVWQNRCKLRQDETRDQ